MLIGMVVEMHSQLRLSPQHYFLLCPNPYYLYTHLQAAAFAVSTGLTVARRTHSCRQHHRPGQVRFPESSHCSCGRGASSTIECHGANALYVAPLESWRQNIGLSTTKCAFQIFGDCRSKYGFGDFARSTSHRPFLSHPPICVDGSPAHHGSPTLTHPTHPALA